MSTARPSLAHRLFCSTRRAVPACAITAALLAAGPEPSHAAVPAGNEFQVNDVTAGAQESPKVAFDAVSGTYVVVWESAGEDGGGRGVYARRYDSLGNPLGAPSAVNTYTADDQANPAVAALAAGGFVVAWESLGQDGDFFGIFARRYDSAGAPVGGEFQVNTYTTNAQETPDLCADASGAVTVVWESRMQDGDSSGVFARRYDASLSPVGAEFQVNTYTAYLQGAPRVECQPTAGGDRLVMWESIGQEGGIGGNRGIFAQRLQADGTPLGSEFLVNSYLNYLQSVPAAAVKADGSFVIAWGSNTQDGDSMGVFLRRYDSNGTPTMNELQVNTFTFDRQRNPRVAMRDNGDFVVAWESYNQERRRGRWGAFAQRFASTGAPVGREFAANSYVRLAQGDPDVAMNPADGGFLIAWNSELQDGEGFGVYAQRFASDQLCGAAPRTGCVQSGRAALRVRNKACDPLLGPCALSNIKDMVLWKWAKGATPPPLDPFGADDMPETSDDEALALCLYDQSAGVPVLAADLVIPASGLCGGNDCWTGPSGASLGKYRDRDVNPHGVKKVILGERSVTLVARGMLVSPPALPLAFDQAVTVQLVGGNGGCIESVFDASATVNSNDAQLFDVRN